jgi:hypothetical protein
VSRPSGEEEKKGIDWRRVYRGLYWLGFGILFLLTTQELLPWTFWWEALTYWPVLLVGLGIRLIFERSRMPAAILLSPVLIFGTLTYVARAEASNPGHRWIDLRAERPEGLERWTLHGRMAMANVDVRSHTLPEDLLVEGRTSSRSRHAAYVSGSDEHARVRIGESRSRRWHFALLPTRRDGWEFAVADDLPLTLTLDMAFISGDMDLSTTALKQADMDGAFNDLVLVLGKPESDVRLDFEGAFNHVELIVPPTVPVSVNSDGFLNVSDGRPGAHRLTGPRYRLNVDGAFNLFEIRSF